MVCMWNQHSVVAFRLENTSYMVNCISSCAVHSYVVIISNRLYTTVMSEGDQLGVKNISTQNYHGLT